MPDSYQHLFDVSHHYDYIHCLTKLFHDFLLRLTMLKLYLSNEN